MNQPPAGDSRRPVGAAGTDPWGRSGVLGGLTLIVAVSVGLMTACVQSDGQAMNVVFEPTLDEFINWEASFSLEENDSVLNITPAVTVVHDGLLIADRSENQVRSYNLDGSLRWALRSVSGQMLTKVLSVTPLRDSLLAIGTDGKAHALATDGSGGRTISLNISEAHYAAPFPGNRMAVATRFSPGDTTGLLRIFDGVRLTEVARLFRPRVEPALLGAASLAGWAGFSVRADTAAAYFSLADTIWLFSDDTQIEAIPLPSRRRLAAEPLPRNSARKDRVEWAARTSMINGLWWKRDGSFLVQYMEFVDNRARYSLLHMSREGEYLFEVAGSSELLAWDAAADTGYFVDPTADEPNRIVIGRLR